jgi:glycosyltransferase involved in cell wall biosynthesis
MRVLHLLASPVYSGPAETVTQLALAQRALGHEVRVAIDRKRTRATSEELAAPRLEALGLLDESGLELSVKSTPWAMGRDVLRLRALAIDVVHSHFSHDHTLLALGRPPGARVVRSVHAPRSLTALTPGADLWTVPTEALARRLLGKRVMVLPALVDPAFVPGNREQVRAQLGLPRGPLVGLVSTMQPSRRHDLAIEAFALLLERVPDATLVLVGDGLREPALRAQVAAAGLGARVVFAGYQSGARFVSYLQALDELWLLGLGNDFSARAAAQARACGVRVVAVDEGALARTADALVEPTPQAIAAAALGADRRVVTSESNEAIASRLLALLDAP